MDYLRRTYFFDYHSDVVQNLVSELQEKAGSEQELAVSLYEMVRDGWRYDPYTVSYREENYKASSIAQRESGNCVEKSIMLITCLRAVGIPARLHLGKVKNHIAIERVIERYGIEELTPHGMVNMHLDGQWLKCSPAFNKALCEIFNVEPLEFNGEEDSFLQQYNAKGDQFMEYIEDYGYFKDVPVEFMKKNLEEHYPDIFKSDDGILDYRL